MKFSKFSLLLLLLILAFSLAACGRKDKGVDKGQNDELQEEMSYFSSSVIDLFKQKKPLKCTAEIESEEGSIKMTYYFDNKNEQFRVDSSSLSKYDNNEVNSFGILKDDWYYFWDDLMNVDGMKTKIFEEDDAEEFEYSEEDDSGLNMDEEFDFKCKSWKVDSSFFEIPQDKSFKDLSNFLESQNFTIPVSYDNNNSSPGLNDLDLCSFCDMLPAGPERDECLASC